MKKSNIMIAILGVLTFIAAVLIDHLVNREPIPVAELPKEAPQRPRLVPSLVAGFEVPDNLR